MQFKKLFILLLVCINFLTAQEYVLEASDADTSTFTKTTGYWFPQNHTALGIYYDFIITFAEDVETQSATWKKSSGFSSGTYEVSASIPHLDSSYDPTSTQGYQDNYYPTRNATYKIYDGSTYLGSKTISHDVSSTVWVSLGSYTFYSYPKIVLTDKTNSTEMNQRKAIVFSAIRLVSVPTPQNGRCGTADKVFAATDTSFNGYTFCESGTQNPSSISFPAKGRSVSWTCEGINGGSDDSCTASREESNSVDAPDLIVEKIEIRPQGSHNNDNKIDTGEEYDVTVYTTNIGTVPSNSYDVEYYLKHTSQTSYGSPFDTDDEGKTDIGEIDTENSTERFARSPGEYDVKVCITDTEPNEPKHNNCKETSFTIYGNEIPNTQDLSLESIQITLESGTTLEVGERIEAEAIVKNLGAVESLPSIANFFYANNRDNFSDHFDSRDVISREYGEISFERSDITTSHIGVNYIKVCLGDLPAEDPEENNCRIQSFYVNKIGITLDSVSPGTGTEKVAQYTFTAHTSVELPTGYKVFLNFNTTDDSGNWLGQNDPGGHVEMTCTGTVCSLTTTINEAGTRKVRVGVFNPNDELSDTCSSSETFIVEEEIINQRPEIRNINTSIDHNGKLTISFDPYDPEDETMGADVYLSNPDDTNNFNFTSKKTYTPGDFSGTITRSFSYTKSELGSFGIIEGKTFKVRINLFDIHNEEAVGYSNTINYLVPVNGECGTAHNHLFSHMDTEYGSYLQCAAGSPSNTNFPLDGETETWICSGINGGVASGECIASRDIEHIPDIPSLNSPENGANLTDTVVELDWSSVIGATHYKLALADINGNKVYDLIDLNITSQTTPPLSTGIEYVWAVKACNGAGCSDTNPYRFTIADPLLLDFSPKSVQRGVETEFTLTGQSLPQSLIANVWGTKEHCEQTSYSSTEIKFTCTVWSKEGSRQFYVKDSQQTDKSILFPGTENWFVEVMPEPEILPNSAPSVQIDNLPDFVRLDEQFTVNVKSYDPDGNLLSVQADWEADGKLDRKVDVSNSNGTTTAFSYTRTNNDLSNLKIRFIVTDSENEKSEVTYVIPVLPGTLILDPVSGYQDVDGLKEKINKCEYVEKGTNPISPSNGAKIEKKLLLQVNGVVPVTFAIGYNSLMLDNDILGIGWDLENSHTSKLIEDSNGDVTIYWSNHRQHRFSKTPDGNYSSVSFGCRLDTLTKLSDGTFKVQRRAKDIYTFDEFNFLKRIENHKGQGIDLQYDTNSRLIRASEPVSGKYIEYMYEGNHLVKARTSGGNEVSFSYTGDFLTGITHADGMVESFSYTELGQIVEHKTDGILVSRTFYDQLGRAVRQEDVDTTNQDFRFDYNETEHNITTTVTDRLGYVSVKSFDKNYQLIYERDNMGNEKSYIYNDDGKPTSITDSRGNTTHFEYNEYGDVTKTTTPDNAVETREYDANRNLVKLTNASNKTRVMLYDGQNNMTSLTDERGYTTIFEHNHNNQKTSETTPEGRTTAYGYDIGMLTSITSPEGYIRYIRYDADGRVTQESDYMGNFTIYELDALGRKLSQTDPLGHKQIWEYNTRGKLVLYKDAKNSHKDIADSNVSYTKHEYDQSENRVKTIAYNNGLAYEWKYEFDGENRLVKKTDPKGNTTRYERDALGRIVKVYDALNHLVKQYSFDENGNVIKETDALNKESISSYDAMNRLTQKKDPLNQLTKFSYDILGRVTKTEDALNRIWENSYNEVSLLTSVLSPGSITTSQSFDMDGNLVDVTEPDNDTRILELDNNARVSTETTADAVALNYQYNPNDLLTNYTNGRGETTSYLYDDASRMLSKSDTHSTVNYTYDANGNTVLVTENNASISRKYDGLNRVVEYSENNESIKFEFDKAGNLQTIHYPPYVTEEGSPLRVDYGYDSLNRITGVLNLASYEYDNKDRLTKVTRVNGTVLTLYYDSADRLIKSKDVDANGTVIAEQDYIYDSVGRLVSENIVPEQSPPNRLLKDVTMAYAEANRLIEKDGTTLDFDADGNILTVGAQNLVFNTRNELVEVGDYSYTYNAEGYRLKRTLHVGEDKEETSYFVSPDNMGLVKVLSEKKPDGTKRYFVYGAQGLFAQYNSSEEKWYYFHYDYRGSVIAVTDEDGKVVARYGYMPYGKQYTVSGSFETPFGYNGRDGVITDPNGLVYMRARYYSPEQRRFVSKDPIRGKISDHASLNRYAYVGGDPVNLVDPSGNVAVVPLMYACIAIGTRLAPVVVGGYHTARNFYLVNAPRINATAIFLFGEVPASNTMLPAGGGSSVGVTQRTVNSLHRPYLRKSTKEVIKSSALKTTDGKYIDPNTYQVIEGKFHYGHKYGHENWRLIDEAESKGWTQKELNNYVNNNPQFFQIEDPLSNMSHKFEKK